MGNLIDREDAKGNVNRRVYNSAGMVTSEIAADGAIDAFSYDRFGNVVYEMNAQGIVESYLYDKNNRLVKRGNEVYRYNENDQRIASLKGVNWDFVGSWDYNEYYYDRYLLSKYTYFDESGRVIIAAGSNDTVRTYQYFDLAGGNTKTISTEKSGKTLEDVVDIYGKILSHKDLGNRTFRYFYNEAGKLIRQVGNTDPASASIAIPVNLLLSYYDNTSSSNFSSRGLEQYIEYHYDSDSRLASITDYAMGETESYVYDAMGNRVREELEYYNWPFWGKGRTTTVEYDELNRLKSTDVLSNIYGVARSSHTAYEYDANGNRRRIYNVFSSSSLNGTDDYWYDYDEMNRFTVAKGSLSGPRGSAQIVSGSNGYAIGYNLAGQRISSNNETYSYDYNGVLTDTYVNGVLRSHRGNDHNGNLVNYTEYMSDGTLANSTTYRLDEKNRVAQIKYYESSNQPVPTSNSTYTYNDDGNLVQVYTEQNDDTTITKTYTYHYWDVAKQKEIASQASNEQAPGWQPGYSRFTYNHNGHLSALEDVEGNRARLYQLNFIGQIVGASDTIDSTTYTHDYYYFRGISIGDGGDNGINVKDFGTIIEESQSESDHSEGADPVSSSSGDYGYQPISSTYPATSPSSYTVRAGDSLYSIASAIWGDPELWYLLVDANGLTNDSGASLSDPNAPLTPNTVLTIPNVVSNVHNNESTFKPYDPSIIIGNTDPTLPDPPPPPTDKCEQFVLTVFVVAVVVVVSVATQGALSGTVGAWGAAVLGAAAGNAAGQLVSIGLGLQEDFSWSSVGASAITAGFTQGLNVSAGDSWYVSAGKALASSAITQGINLAFDLQEEFDWDSVATAVLAAPVNSSIKDDSTGYSNTTSASGASYEGFNVDFSTGFQTNVVNQISKIVVTGEGKIDWANAAANSLGSAIGNAAGAEIDQTNRRIRQLQLREHYQRANKPFKLDRQGNPHFLTQEEINQGKDMERQRLVQSSNGRVDFEPDKHGNTVVNPGDDAVRNESGELRYTTDQSKVLGYGVYEKNPYDQLVVPMTDHNGNVIYDQNNQAVNIYDPEIVIKLASAPYGTPQTIGASINAGTTTEPESPWVIKNVTNYEKLDPGSGDQQYGFSNSSVQGAYISMMNTITGEGAIAFKGSDRLGDFIDDLDPGLLGGGQFGADTYETVRHTAGNDIALLESAGVDRSQIYSVGHSLGGAMAQSFALENNLNGAGLNSLPVSNLVLDRRPGIIQAYNNSGLHFEEFNFGGEIATFNYSAFLGQEYIDSTPTEFVTGLGNNNLFGMLGVALETSVNWPFTAAMGLSAYLHTGGPDLAILNNYSAFEPTLDQNQINWNFGFDESGNIQIGVNGLPQ
jgi:pimeloyl-ACP methyl ester carboxylesterase